MDQHDVPQSQAVEQVNGKRSEVFAIDRSIELLPVSFLA